MFLNSHTQGLKTMTESPQVAAGVAALSGGLSFGAIMGIVPTVTALAALTLTIVLIYTHIMRSRRDGQNKALDAELKRKALEKQELEIKILEKQLAELNGG